MSNSPDIAAEVSKIVEESEKYGPENALTLDLSHLRLFELPYEQVERVKSRIARLALGHNSISHLSSHMTDFTRLRYLNIRSNHIREFPRVLCEMSSLEILDISRNKLNALPKNFGCLMSLKVLSVSKNRLKELPAYISKMPNLEILKVDNNPILYPPKTVMSMEIQETDMSRFLAGIQGFFRSEEESGYPVRKAMTIPEDHATHSKLSLAKRNSEPRIPHPPLPHGATNPKSGSSSVPTTTPSAVTVEESESLTTTTTTTTTAAVAVAVAAAAAPSSTTTTTTTTLTPSAPAHVPEKPRRSTPDILVPLSTTLQALGSPSLVSPHSDPQTAPSIASSTNSASTSTTPKSNHTEKKDVTAAALSPSDHLEPPAIPTPQTSPSPTLLGSPNTSNTTLPVSPSSVTRRERFRSNSTSGELRHSRRSSTQRRLQTLDEHDSSSPSRTHTRGHSHDCLLQTTQERMDVDLSSPHEAQKQLGCYFRKLPNTESSESSPTENVRLLEASRGILFALSQVHQMLRNYLLFCNNSSVLNVMQKLLHNANTHVGWLVQVLEKVTESFQEDPFDTQSLIHASTACIASFRRVIEAARKYLNELTGSANVRYTRTLILMLYGSAKELQNSLHRIIPPNAQPAAAENQHVTSPLNHRLPSSVFPRPDKVALGVATPAAIETDHQLLEKVSIAIKSANSVLSLLTDAVAKNALAGAHPQTAATANTNPSTNAKLRELASMAVSASEITRRLKTRIVTLHTPHDDYETIRFFDDTQAFVKAVIAVANAAKSVSTEFSFNKNVLTGLSTLTRCTKELIILLSTFGTRQNPTNSAVHDTQSNANLSPISRVPATPLSAALGSAAQSIISPLIMSPAAMPQSSNHVNYDYFSEVDTSSIDASSIHKP
ncbi:leucine-rich repeat protein Sog2 [Schizosaccharomyces japonicus yFS275]|uniref:Leucine-rich repeat protein Sog2 n=1 Tax=Schizosaccharomyces japonicus (strain yFS275 / FY16936) TaxID=402676 RepID=B6JVB0_SCHJY|nr:leucine-rich repeat protein Sog2 [Schizosaccharomyces japonicus yFS275]EEB05311.1 leucine-rich repeat protein Sog2 [Schizosaccharomyces japonicus yFS275]